MNAQVKSNYLIDAINRMNREVEGDVAVEPKAPSPDQMLTTGQLATLLQMSARTIESWRTDGRGPKVTKISNAVRYRYSDVLNWIADQQKDNP